MRIPLQRTKFFGLALALTTLIAISTMAALGAHSASPVQQDATATPMEEAEMTATPAEEADATETPQEETEATATPMEAAEMTPTPTGEADGDGAADAAELWQMLQEEDYAEAWSTVPGKGELYPGQPPHGALLSTYLNEPALNALEGRPGAMPDGAIVVKENYRPDETLASVTVMEKRAGYAPAYGDWYWARYGPDGTVQGGGTIQSCIACHAAVRTNDYIFTFVVAPVEDISTLATPSPPATAAEATDDAAVADEAVGAVKPSEVEEAATPTPTVTPTPLGPEALISLGEEEYPNYCAACHQMDGQGVAGAYPALADNPFVTVDDPTGVIRVLLTGRAGMPHFRDYLTQQEIAAVISYIRNAWENDASVVSEEQVRTVWDEIQSTSEPMEHNGSSE
jgi:mono/diheme cytochrome c family protein